MGSLLGAGHRKSGKTSTFLRGFLTLETLGTQEESFTPSQILIEHCHVPDIIKTQGTE